MLLQHIYLNISHDLDNHLSKQNNYICIVLCVLNGIHLQKPMQCYTRISDVQSCLKFRVKYCHVSHLEKWSISLSVCCLFADPTCYLIITGKFRNNKKQRASAGEKTTRRSRRGGHMSTYHHQLANNTVLMMELIRVYNDFFLDPIYRLVICDWIPEH